MMQLNGQPQVSSSSPVPLVEMKGISKTFPGVVANDRVDFTVHQGEVRALLGENGAGKTTLMNILYGLYRPDSGEILVRGRSVSIRSPKDAIALRIAMVHQHFELVPTLTVAENVGLGLKAKREPFLNLEGVARRVDELAETYGLKVNTSSRVEQLSVGERQRVEIIKALYREPVVLILDEPTSVLAPQETEGLFHFIRSMASEGRAVVVITHKLPEVMTVSDTVTVLRRGIVVADLQTRLTNPGELADKMVGKELPSEPGDARGTPQEETLLEIRDLSAVNDKGITALDHVSLSVRAGEILGIAGVAGNGQTELAEALSGMRRVTGGKIIVRGKDLTNRSPRDFIEQGVGCIPEDRMGSALVLGLSIAENLIMEVRNSPRFSKRRLVNDQKVRENAKQLVEEYSISCAGVDAPAGTLSGGNMQKLVLAKILSRQPGVIVASQPTAGLDVGAAQFITEKLREQRRLGVAILLISGDLNELLLLSERIACIYEGRIMGTVASEAADIKEIGLMMGGVARS